MRLNKLVLSAGLALTLVASAIPVSSVNAATRVEITKGEDAVSDDDIIKAVGAETAVEPTETGNEKLLTTISNATVENGTISKNSTAVVHDKLTEFISKNGLTLVDGVGQKITDITVTQTTTYTYTATKTLASDDIVTDDTTSSVKPKVKENLIKKAVDIVDEAAGSNSTEGNRKVEVTKANSNGDLVGTIAANSTVTYTATATKKVTWTISDLSTYGYSYNATYDVSGGELDGSNTAYDYVVIKEIGSETSNYDVEEVTSEYSAKDHTVTADITDIGADVVYLLAKKEKSVSGALLFDDGEADSVDAVTKGAVAITGSDLTYSVSNLADADADADTKTALDKVLDGYTHVAYFTVTLSGGNNNLPDGVAATVRIKKPQDILDANSGKTITWKVTSLHGNQTRTWDVTEDGDYIVFNVDEFSTFELSYTAAAVETPTEEESTSGTTEDATTGGTSDATTGTTTTADSSTTSTTASKKTGDNSMMPLFMTTLLLALCAGSLAIYKEKKTN